MMAGAHANPEELRNFAHALAQFNDTIENATGQLSGRFSELGQSWQDQKQQQFEEVFIQLVQTLSRFRDSSGEQINYLHNLANKLDDYLSQ
jgi:uncharacterized protein YukE